MTFEATIRPADYQDVGTLYRFICELEETQLNAVAFRAVFQRNLTDKRVHYLVAEVNEDIVGFISCHVQYLLHHTGKVGEIQELYVVPEYRNQQIGRQLVAAMEELAEAHGFVNLEVTANQKRTLTHRFYQQLTFRPSHFKFVKEFQ
ncbi:GNAT family N-acetyltransferase [Larkinella punicea]|uniref:GNAT family N-acetyltransferase n=1 Tax=Larkinella punicea TaxID=2315727 RepID=A0A368JZE3_9BACT|nr:GNAT family N-acetyltransferase [Larkinella punicea]RCR71571.1 GNAT family N-acetyltransferase [Larkinella punicea]